MSAHTPPEQKLCIAVNAQPMSLWLVDTRRPELIQHKAGKFLQGLTWGACYFSCCRRSYFYCQQDCSVGGEQICSRGWEWTSHNESKNQRLAVHCTHSDTQSRSNEWQFHPRYAGWQYHYTVLLQDSRHLWHCSPVYYKPYQLTNPHCVGCTGYTLYWKNYV